MKLFCSDPAGEAYLARLLRSQAPAGQPYLESVAALASRVHAPETDEEEGPYILHPLRVALILLEEAGVREPQVLAAALLHDAQEHDPALSLAEVASVAGKRAARLASALAFEHRRNPGLPKAVGIARYLKHLEESLAPPPWDRHRADGPELLLLKMADRLDNLRECVRLGRQNKLRKRLLQERRDYAPLFARAPGPAAEALRARLAYFLEQLSLQELPAA